MKDKWRNMEGDSSAYAGSFAAQFGPGGKWPFVEAIEIGNEPGLYDDAAYGRLFDAMAGGIRKANPRARIVTCNVEAGKSDRYWKSADLFKDRAALYDVLQIHRYAIAERWPVWRRTYPENPTVPYLSSVQKLVDWRNANAPGKEVWVTEFGWDSSTRKPDPKGEWAKWVGSTDEEQARWLVRSFFLFAGMGIEKAFVYYFNDDNKPQLHASSGLTRDFQPKPAYHAVAWMLNALADYRFSRVVKASLEEGYVYEFAPEKAGDPMIWAVWHATKEDTPIPLSLAGLSVIKAERMPLKEGAAEAVSSADETKIQGGERPCLVWWKPE